MSIWRAEVEVAHFAWGTILYYAREKQTKVVIACFALHNFLLERRLARTEHENMVRDADYEVSTWVATNASKDMSDVGNSIEAGISLM
jgi:hypothetical protein